MRDEIEIGNDLADNFSRVQLEDKVKECYNQIAKEKFEEKKMSRMNRFVNKYKFGIVLIAILGVIILIGILYPNNERKMLKETSLYGQRTSINSNEDSNQKVEEKKQDEAKFNEYKKKGDNYYLLLVGNPDNKSYKDQAKYYYGLALQYKEDATIRNRFEKLKK